MKTRVIRSTNSFFKADNFLILHNIIRPHIHVVIKTGFGIGIPGTGLVRIRSTDLTLILERAQAYPRQLSSLS